MGKTREQNSSTEIDPDLKAQSLKALDRAWAASEIPFMPNRGVRVAAFSPDQEAAFNNNNAASSAFGLGTGGPISMPPVESANGIRGYSTGDIYDETVAASVPQPIQDYINSMFVDPTTGQRPDWSTPGTPDGSIPPTDQYTSQNPYWNSGEGGYPDGGGYGAQNGGGSGIGGGVSVGGIGGGWGGHGGNSWG